MADSGESYTKFMGVAWQIYECDIANLRARCGRFVEMV